MVGRKKIVKSYCGTWKDCKLSSKIVSKNKRFFKAWHLTALLMMIPGILFTSCEFAMKENSVEIPIDLDTIQEQPVLLSYGIPVDSFLISRGRIKRNQFLADIFRKLDIPYEKTQIIMQKPVSGFNFRKVKAGQPYQVFSSETEPHKVKYFVYIEDPVNYYVFDFGESPNIEHKKKKVRSEIKLISKTIHNSLWQTIKDNHLNPDLALQLSEIYAWTIDFFGLQNGDRFKVIYEEQYVDSTTLGIDRILAASFHSEGKIYYAIPFKQDGKEDFFDEEGNSLRKAFLKAPLRFSHISSRFSNSRYHPILKIRRPHHGVDYAAPTGTPVHAIGDGKVIAKGYYGQSGNRVKIRHNSIYTTAYAHLSRYGKGIHVGAMVKQSQVIGYVGKTGLATGPHLDFRFYKYGKPVDPLKVKAPSVSPINEQNRSTYNQVSKVMIDLLHTFQ